MFKPNIIQRILHRIHILMRRYLASFKRKKLKTLDFTIISNNCWGGVTYEEYGLRKNSPTIGCYFFAKDYLSFVNNLKYYVSLDLKFISIDQSRHKQWIIENGDKGALIGLLGDIEIVFVHYKDEKTAYSKWNNRVKRINWSNLLFKFSFQNHATNEDLEAFEKSMLPGKKFMFINRKNHNYNCGVYYPGFDNDTAIDNDTFYAHKYFDVTTFINKGIILQKKWIS